MRKLQVAGHLVGTLVECIAVAEIVWYYLHDGEQTLHEAVIEWWEGIKEQLEEQAKVRHTVDMIRKLPET